MDIAKQASQQAQIRCTFDSRIFHNPGNKYCIVRMKTEDKSVPPNARANRYFPEVIEETPERLLDIRGITPERLGEIKDSYAESRKLRYIITLLAPFKLTPKRVDAITWENRLEHAKAD